MQQNNQSSVSEHFSLTGLLFGNSDHPEDYLSSGSHSVPNILQPLPYTNVDLNGSSSHQMHYIPNGNGNNDNYDEEEKVAATESSTVNSQSSMSDNQSFTFTQAGHYFDQAMLSGVMNQYNMTDIMFDTTKDTPSRETIAEIQEEMERSSVNMLFQLNQMDLLNSHEYPMEIHEESSEMIEDEATLTDMRYVRPTDTPMANLMPPEYADVDVRCLYPHYDKDKPPRFSKLFPPKFDLNVYTRNVNAPNEKWSQMDAEYDSREHVVINDIDFGVWANPEEIDALQVGDEINPLYQWEKLPPSVKGKSRQEQEQGATKDTKKTAQTGNALKDQMNNVSWRYGAAKMWYDRLNIPEDADIERVFDPRVTELRGLPWQIELEMRANAPSINPFQQRTEDLVKLDVNLDEKPGDNLNTPSIKEPPFTLGRLSPLEEDEGGVVMDGLVHETKNEETGEVLTRIDDGQVPPSPMISSRGDLTQEEIVPSAVKSEEDGGESVSEAEDDFAPEKLPLFRLINWEEDIIWDAETDDRKITRSLYMNAPQCGWVPTGVCPTISKFQEHYDGRIVGVTAPIASNQDTEYTDLRRIRNIAPPRQALMDGTWINDIIWDVTDLDRLPPPVTTTIEPHDIENWEMVLYEQHEFNAIEDYRAHYKKLCYTQVERVAKSAAGLSISMGPNARIWPRLVPPPPPFLQLTQTIKSSRIQEARFFHEQIAALLHGTNGSANVEENAGPSTSSGTGVTSSGTHGTSNVVGGSSMPTPAAAGPLRFRQPSKAAARMGDHIEKAKKILGRHGLLHEEDEVQESTGNQMEEEETCRLMALLRRDPYNLSLDEFYCYSANESQSLVAPTQGGMLSAVDVQHSIPALELYPPFFPTYLTEARARHFYRPPLRIRNLRTAKGIVQLFNRELPILNLKRHIERREKERQEVQEATGGGHIFVMRKPEDLSAMDGHIIFMEYSEEFPPLMGQPGMASRILNYYRRGFNADGTERPPPELPYGENTFTHKPPFMGQLKPGQHVQSMENRMFRAPIYQHEVPTTDFLIVRARGSFYIRRVDTIFTVGQLCPLMEVPAPNSKKAAAFAKDFLKVFIERLFLRSEFDPPRIKIEDVRHAFPNHSETSIRKRLKEVAEFRRTGNDASWWVYKVGVKGMPSEHVLRRLITPEDCCAYYSMMQASQRLKDAGYKAQMEAEGEENELVEEQTKMADEIKAAPWHTTNAFMSAQRGKCFLELHGAADPTGHGEALSYVKISGKTGAQVLRSIAEGNDGLAQWMNQPVQADAPGVRQHHGVGPGRRMVTGTDADLRKLTLGDAKQMLRNHGIPESEIKKLKRWDIVNVVRALSTEKAKKGEQEGMAKFARGGRMSGAELQERYREELQRMFELQNRLLASDELLSTDEGSSSEDADSEAEELGKNVESMLMAVNRGATAAAALRQKQMQREREEAEQRELFMNRLAQPLVNAKKTNVNGNDVNSNIIEQLLQQPVPSHAVRRELRIKRTYMTPEGQTYTRSQIVPWSYEVDFYLEMRKSWPEDALRQFAGEATTIDKEERRREKRRLQDRLRRIKKQEQEQERRRKLGLPIPAVKTVKKISPPAPSGDTVDSAGTSNPPKVTPPKKRIKQVCGACGIVGHMRTNKCCPLYNQPPGTTIPPGIIPNPNASGLDQTGEDGKTPAGINAVALSGGPRKRPTKKKIKLILPAPQLPPPSQALHELQSVTVSELLCREIPSENEPLPFEDKDLASHVGGAKIRFSGRLFSHVEENLKKSLQMRIPKQVLEKLHRVEEETQAAVAAAEELANKEKIAAMAAQKQAELYPRTTVGCKRKASRSGAGSTSQLSAANKAAIAAAHRIESQRGDYSYTEKYSGNRRRINPLVSLNHVLEMICRAIPSKVEDCQYFLQPVSRREYPQYYNFIVRPMDLATIRRKCQENEYTSRVDFIEDINLIKDNCIRFNGEDSLLADRVEKLVKFVWEQLLQKENKLMRYELMINPLLDADDVAFNYYLTQAIEAMKEVEHSLMFQQPVDKKRYKNYYEVVKDPMDLSKIEEKIKRRVYHTREEFLSDVALMVNNCILFNTETHPLTLTIQQMQQVAVEKLAENDEALAELEEKLKASRQQDDQVLDEDMLSPHTGVDTESVFSRPSNYPPDAQDEVEHDDEIYDEDVSLLQSSHLRKSTILDETSQQRLEGESLYVSQHLDESPDISKLGLQLSESEPEVEDESRDQTMNCTEPTRKRRRIDDKDDGSGYESSSEDLMSAHNAEELPPLTRPHHLVADDLKLSDSDQNSEDSDQEISSYPEETSKVDSTRNDAAIPPEALSYLQADLAFSDEEGNGDDISVITTESERSDSELPPDPRMDNQETLENVYDEASSTNTSGSSSPTSSADSNVEQKDSKVHFYIGDSQDGFEESDET